MKLADEVCWFAVHTRPGLEASAESRLRELPVATFLPCVHRLLRHARRRALKVRRPLFTGYLFARFSAAQLLRAVNGCPGVRRVLGTSEGPRSVPDAIIASIQRRTDADGCVALADPALAQGDAVRITMGVLGGWSGVFERELSDARRTAILIETLQQSCRVIVWRDEVERIDAR